MKNFLSRNHLFFEKWFWHLQWVCILPAIWFLFVWSWWWFPWLLLSFGCHTVTALAESAYRENKKLDQRLNNQYKQGLNGVSHKK